MTSTAKLQRWLNLMEDAVQDTHASGRPAATLEGAWAGLKAELEMSERGEVSTQFKAVGYVDLAGVAHWEPGRLTEGVEAMLYIAEGKHG